ncbi:MAG: serine/threonine protein kinase [Bryobacteraceae bacterium]|nr:serine/threonine protein kinase [Bryobacteraceae bacterium]
MTAEEWQQVKSVLGQALDQPTESRVSWLNQNCLEIDLRNEVISLLEAHHASDFLEESAGGGGADLAAVLGPGSHVGERVGPWLLTQEIGQGGMGTVYRAIRADDEFRREVAIKIVSRGMDTEILLRRFRTERQILANLEHPYVARLIDGGSTSSGLPYFVMEFIRGIPLTEYCDQNRLSLTERIGLFRKVCSAVAYAHNNLIVHRDLKPANILVTDDGTPKLLDFGIARILSGPGRESSEPTLTMLRMATPAYASPEQIRGFVAGIPSDIYSLGVILYELLTGHRPYRLSAKNSEELAQVICEREPTRASIVVGIRETLERSNGFVSVVDPELVCRDRATTLDVLKRKLRGDLDKIVAMALRKEAHRRYESVDQFSEDLQRHGAGIPIVARRDTLSYRTAKFIDRHRLSVGAGFAVAIVLLFMSLFAIHKAAKLAHRVEEDHKLATSFLVEIHDNIARLPGAATARETMLRQSLKYLDGLAADSGSGPEVQRSLAMAYEKFAELQIGRNGPGIGKASEARDTHRRAQVIREAIANASPRDLKVKFELATNYVLGGYIAGRATNPEVRRSYDDRAIYIAEALVAKDPHNVQYRRVLASAYLSLGYGLISEEKWDPARKAVRKAMAVLTEVAAENPGDLITRRELAGMHYRLGMSFVQSGEPGNGVDNLKQALRYQLQVEAADPENAGIRLEIASTRHFAGMALTALGQFAEAIQHFDRAIEIRQSLVDADPRDFRTRSMLAGNYSRRSVPLLETGRRRDALESAMKAVYLQEHVLSADPTGSPDLNSMAEFEAQLGRIYEECARSGEPDQFRSAVQWYGRALSRWQKLIDEGVLRGPNTKKFLENTRQALRRCELATTTARVPKAAI